MFFKYFLVIILLNFLNTSLVIADSAEITLGKCHYGDNACIQNAVQYVAEHFSKGYKDIKLPSIDPLHIDVYDMIRDVDENDRLTLDWKCKDIDFLGFSKAIYTISGFEKDIATSNVTMKVHFPKFWAIGDYKLKMRFKNRHSHGKGRFIYEFDDYELYYNFVPTVYEKDGKNYMKMKEIHVSLKLGTVNIHYGDMFDGDRDLTRAENSYLNENSGDFFKLVERTMCENWERIFTALFDETFGSIPMDQMFLE